MLLEEVSNCHPPKKKLQYRAGSTVLGGGADSVVESGVYGKKCLCYNSSKSLDKQKKMYPKSWEALTRCVCIGGGGQLHDSSLWYIGKKTVCCDQNLGGRGAGAQGHRSSLGPLFLMLCSLNISHYNIIHTSLKVKFLTGFEIKICIHL